MSTIRIATRLNTGAFVVTTIDANAKFFEGLVLEGARTARQDGALAYAVGGAVFARIASPLAFRAVGLTDDGHRTLLTATLPRVECARDCASAILALDPDTHTVAIVDGDGAGWIFERVEGGGDGGVGAQARRVCRLPL